MVNLGSPDSADEKDVRRYLNQFLMDPHVIDRPWGQRRFIVSAFVLPGRAAKSAEAYRSIWWPEGAPLKVISQRLCDKVQAQTDLPVALGMRYGSPSIADALKELVARDPMLEEVLLVPLYPHYAMSTVKSVVAETQRTIRKNKLARLRLKQVLPFYNNPDYIKCLLDSAAPYLEQPFDHLLFSYHGVPERHIRKDDPTGNHCLKKDQCCRTASMAHATCYRHQVLETTEAFVAAAGLSEEQYSVAFQSRLGRDKWLEPTTESRLAELAAAGKKRVLVICPAFVADCLETLEEIGIRGREAFCAAGGEELTLIPCLNEADDWARVLARWGENA